LRDRKYKTQKRTTNKTRNKAEEENQIRDLTRDFKDGATIPSIANDACSADQ
jgi:hypothetical protein